MFRICLLQFVIKTKAGSLKLLRIPAGTCRRTIQPWGDGGQESMGPNRLRRAIPTTASGAGDDLTRRLNVCGRPLERKHVVRTVRYAVRRSLMSDLSILALHSCRGPVWRCADRVRIALAGSKPLHRHWFSQSRLIDRFPLPVLRPADIPCVIHAPPAPPPTTPCRRRGRPGRGMNRGRSRGWRRSA